MERHEGGAAGDDCPQRWPDCDDVFSHWRYGGRPGETAYALTKAAIVGLTKSLAVEYAQSGIRVNAICHGYVRTPMAESIARQSNPEDPESVLTEMAKAIPMRRLADPLEVGELAAFLASDESSYLTGTQNVIDGGSTLPETVSVGI